MLSIGKKVICIRANWEFKAWPLPVRTPELYQVYKVREIVVLRRGAALRFEEIVNPSFQTNFDGYGEPAFNHKNFVPLEERSNTMIEEVLSEDFA